MSDRLRRALGASPDVVVLVDALGTLLEAGPSTSGVFGHRPEDLRGRSCFEFVHPDDVLLAVEGLTDTLATPGRASEHVRIRVADATGTWRPAEIVVNNQLHDPGVAGIVLTVRDRSGDETVERTVREREDRYRQIAELALEGVWYLDQGNRTTFVTHRMATLVGRTVEGMLGRHVGEFVHPDDAAAVEERLERRHRGLHQDHSFRLAHSSGRSVWIRMSSTPVHAPDGTYLGAIALVSDVTEQRLAQERLAATEAREAAILHALPDMLFRVSPDGTILEHRSGRDGPTPFRTRLTGRNLHDVVPPAVADRAFRALEAAMRTGHVAGFAYELQVDGTLRNYEARMSSVGGVEVVALVRDVTEIHEAERSRQEYLLEVQRREAAEELAEMERGMARAARLEALGRLAGGMAHDMNNLLGVIANYSGAVLRSTDEPATRADVVEIERVVRRGTQLTKRLLMFGRQDHTTVEVQDLVAIATGVGAMLSRTIGPSHELRLDVGREPVWTSVDRSQLEQAVINLVLNARDAAPDGTPIVVSVDRDGDTAALAVADRGPGMPPEVQERAFEPFFTTKEPGSGTGLGLAVVHGVAVEAGGAVRIDCPDDGGTTVTLVLPGHDGPAAAAETTVPPDPALRPGARVLVVDDEEDVRRSLARMLECEGFTVDVVGSGERALDLLAGPVDVEVVLADVSMPGMTGTELADRLRTARPGLPVVLLTGYGTDLVAPPAGAVVVSKPPVVDELVPLLARLAGRSRARDSAWEVDEAEA